MKYGINMIFTLAVLAVSLTLNGCGKKNNRADTQRPSGTQEEIGNNSTGVESAVPEIQDEDKDETEPVVQRIPLQVDHPEEINVAGILQNLLAGTAVQLNAGSLLGSGVIFSLDAEEMVIVTASHVVGDADEVGISFADGSYAESGDLWKSDAADAAFIRLSADTLTLDSSVICKAAMDKEAFDALESGDGIVVMGSADGTGANAYEGKLLETWIYMDDFQQYMTLAMTYAFPGMSGGGVFDLRGYFIGILCGGNEENEAAVLPLSIILSEYEKYRG